MRRAHQKQGGECAPEEVRMKELLARLVSFASENPPGREAEVALFLGGHLKPLGFAVEIPEVAPGRRNVVARLDNGSCPTLTFPGALDVAHQPDEFVPVDELVTAASIYRDLMLRLLQEGMLGCEANSR